MKCMRVELPGAPGGAIVCGNLGGRRTCSGCGKKTATRMCDWKIGDGKTCDALLCPECSYRPVGTHNKDLCSTHRSAWEKHPRNATAVR